MIRFLCENNYSGFCGKLHWIGWGESGGRETKKKPAPGVQMKDAEAQRIEGKERKGIFQKSMTPGYVGGSVG